MYPKLEAALARYKQLEQQMADPAAASDGAKLSQMAKEHGQLTKQVTPYIQLKTLIAEIEALGADAGKESDPEMKQMLQDEIALKEKERQELQSKIEDMLLVDPGEDFDSIIVEVRAGTGGDEASLFASDLYNMYSRYAALKGWKVETLDFNSTDAGGFKDISFTVSGEGCYRFLRYESGGHRVQRVPKTETQGRIHTSAATVAVLPEPTEIQVEIRPEDIETQTFSCGGPGGQHVNKTQSGVRLIHKPTGVVAESRQERSQHKNKDICWRMIRTRIYEAQQEKANKERAAMRKGMIGTGSRNDRIRTYNFPQNRVTDHRINLTLHSLDKFMLGELRDMVRALMDEDKKEQLSQITGAK